MHTLTKRDLFCNYKWLDKLKRFSDELVTEDATRIRIIILTRHKGFRPELQTSKTKFKKISSEHLNDTENYKLILCSKKQTMTEFQLDYQIMFLNYKVSAMDMLKYVNIMIAKIAKTYYPIVLKGHWKYEYNTSSREALINKLTLFLSNSLDEYYMESQYTSPENNDDKGATHVL